MPAFGTTDRESQRPSLKRNGSIYSHMIKRLCKPIGMHSHRRKPIGMRVHRTTYRKSGGTSDSARQIKKAKVKTMVNPNKRKRADRTSREPDTRKCMARRTALAYKLHTSWRRNVKITKRTGRDW